ncbi:Nucleoporin Nup43 [Glugoides intestinalis]
MEEYKIKLMDIETRKIASDNIVDISLNHMTGVLAAACADSRVILTNISKDIENPVASTVQLNLDHINKVEWLNHYDFVVVGTDEYLHYFSVMNLRSVLFHIHLASIVAMKKRGEYLCTGSADGTVCLWDFREEKEIQSINHVIRSKKQPIKDLDMSGNYIFTSTLYKGKVWVWDLRNTSKHLNIISSKSCVNWVELVDGNVYTASDAGVIKLSQTLEMQEFVYKNENQQPFTKHSILFNERYNSLLFTFKDNIFTSKLGVPNKIEKQEVKDILGLERYETDKAVVFRRNGIIRILELFPLIE